MKLDIDQMLAESCEVIVDGERLCTIRTGDLFTLDIEPNGKMHYTLRMAVRRGAWRKWARMLCAYGLRVAPWYRKPQMIALAYLKAWGMTRK